MSDRKLLTRSEFEAERKWWDNVESAQRVDRLLNHIETAGVFARETITPVASVRTEPADLSRRDEFAKAAMQGLIPRDDRYEVPYTRRSAIAADAVAIADALIAALDGDGAE